MIEFEIRRGIFASQAEARKLGKKVGNDVLDAAAASVLNRIRQRFLEEKDPDGKPWVPSYAGLARRARGDTGTLYDTGRLFNSIELLRKDDGERVVGVNTSQAPYAINHQLGLEGNVARPFIGLGTQDKVVVNLIIKKRVGKSIA